MKRCIMLTVSFIMILFTFCGCGQKSAYKPLVVDFSDSVSEISLSNECSGWNYINFYDESQPKNASVEWNGENLNLTYKGSHIRMEAREQRHTYSVDDDVITEIDLDSQGNVVGVDYKLTTSEENVTLKTQAECEAIAEQFLLSVCDINLSKYRKTVKYIQGGKLYSIRYVKCVNDVPTVESFSIWVKETGDIYFYIALMTNKIIEANVPSFSLDDITAAVVERLDEMTVTAREVYDEVEYKNFAYEIRINDSSQYVMYVKVSVACTEHFETEYEVGTEVIEFIVPL